MGPAEIAFQVFLPGLEFLVLLCAVAVVALILGAVWIYRDAESRRMDAAIWVILLILATLVLNLIGFFVVLIVYLIARESHPVGGGLPYGYGYPPGVPPAVGPPPVPAACPVCGNPMTWYPQYARWYCTTCGQYR